MQRDLGLSPAGTGAILGAFGLGYAITTLIGGFAVDRYGAAPGAHRRRHPVEPVDRHDARSPAASPSSTRRACCWACRKGSTSRPLTGAVSHWLSPHERATGAGQCLAGRAAGARRSAGRSSPQLLRLARLAPHLRGPVRPVRRLGAAVVLPVPRQSGGLALRRCRPSSPISAPAILRSPPRRMPCRIPGPSPACSRRC